MTKYDYIGLFQASGGSEGNGLPATETKSLKEAMGYLSSVNNGELRAPALVMDEKDSKVITVVAALKYDDIAGKSEARIYELLDRNIDEQLERAERESTFDPWSVDLNSIYPRN